MLKSSLEYFAEMSKKGKGAAKLDHPAVSSIINFGHAKQNSYINNKIISVLLYSHNLVNKTINEALVEAYGK